MKKITFFIMALLWLVNGYSQGAYLYENNTKVYLEEIPDKKFIAFENDGSENPLNLLTTIVPTFEGNDFVKGKLFSNEINKNLPGEKKMAWAVLKNQGNNNLQIDAINYAASYYSLPNGSEIGLTNIFYVKLKDNSDINIIKSEAIKYKAIVHEDSRYMGSWYRLTCDKYSLGNALELANIFYESGLFANTQANFLDVFNYTKTTKPQNETAFYCKGDPLVSNQWSLNNGSSSVFDINMCPAWDITDGSSEIAIAVNDGGSENHIESVNYSKYNYDSETGGECFVRKGLGDRNEGHGMCITGIIGAKSNNQEGIPGIAGDCELMAISNDFKNNPLLNEHLSKAINYAWQHGAAVINNSWGGVLDSPVVNDAIYNALTNGRGGLGTVVVFASGNFDSYGVLSPANAFDDIIVVGAATQ